MPWNSLHTYAMEGKSNEIKDEVMTKGILVREKTELTGMMPIHKACMYGRKAAFEKLIELGADVRATTNWGSTCLHWVVKGYVYHSQGADTASYQAEEYISIAKLILEANPKQLEKKDGKGRTPKELAKALNIESSRSDEKQNLFRLLEQKEVEQEQAEIKRKEDEDRSRPKVRRV